VSEAFNIFDEVFAGSFEKKKKCIGVIFQHNFTKEYWTTFAEKRIGVIRNHVHDLKGIGNIGDAFIAKLAVEHNVISVYDDTASTAFAAGAAAAATIAAVQNVNPSKAQQAGSVAASAVMSAAAGVYAADNSIIKKSKYDKLSRIANGGRGC
jgi:hypothetical protein